MVMMRMMAKRFLFGFIYTITLGAIALHSYHLLIECYENGVMFGIIAFIGLLFSPLLIITSIESEKNREYIQLLFLTVGMISLLLATSFLYFYDWFEIALFSKIGTYYSQLLFGALVFLSATLIGGTLFTLNHTNKASQPNVRFNRTKT